MGSFKKTYKKISSNNIAGTSGLVIDNLFQQGHHYFIVGFNIEYVNTGGHLFLYFRTSNQNYTGGAYSRDSQVMQHGQGDIIHQSNHGSTNGGTVGYCGDQPEESLGFKLYIQPRGSQGWANAYSDAIGHVNGTGYRGQKDGVNLNTNSGTNGIGIVENGAGNFASGIIDVYRVETGDHL
tara:strand:+ start:14330 stop:14869 length:540 start_codon:yes stop_codon:yes gene_type:complete